MEMYSSKTNIIALPCPGLVELIESGVWEGSQIKRYLSERFSGLNTNEVTDIVLGCTHYIFIKDQIIELFNSKIRVIDGNEGTVRQLRRVLASKGLYKQDMQSPLFDQSLPEFYFSSSKDKVLNLCKQWMEKQINSR